MTDLAGEIGIRDAKVQRRIVYEEECRYATPYDANRASAAIGLGNEAHHIHDLLKCGEDGDIRMGGLAAFGASTTNFSTSISNFNDQKMSKLAQLSTREGDIMFGPSRRVHDCQAV